VKKEFTYRGFTMEQLTNMPMWPETEEDDYIVGLLPSRVRRSLGRGMSIENEHFLDRMLRSSAKTFEHIAETCPFLPQFVGRRIAIHNGQHFVEIDVKPEMIGHYLGEFAVTRRGVAHSGPGVGATRSSKHVPLK
jgi:small subunit ribosomal protein S19